MFQKLKKIRLPFMPKKALGMSLDEMIVAALEEAKNYPLIVDNEQLTTLFKNKFVTERGVQVPPREFVAKIINYIENNPPQTAQQFSVYVERIMTTISSNQPTKKK